MSPLTIARHACAGTADARFRRLCPRRIASRDSTGLDLAQLIVMLASFENVLSIDEELSAVTAK